MLPKSVDQRRFNISAAQAHQEEHSLSMNGGVWRCRPLAERSVGIRFIHHSFCSLRRWIQRKRQENVSEGSPTGTKAPSSGLPLFDSIPCPVAEAFIEFSLCCIECTCIGIRIFEKIECSDNRAICGLSPILGHTLPDQKHPPGEMLHIIAVFHHHNPF